MKVLLCIATSFVKPWAWNAAAFGIAKNCTRKRACGAVLVGTVVHDAAHEDGSQKGLEAMDWSLGLASGRIDMSCSKTAADGSLRRTSTKEALS